MKKSVKPPQETYKQVAPPKPTQGPATPLPQQEGPPPPLRQQQFEEATVTIANREEVVEAEAAAADDAASDQAPPESSILEIAHVGGAKSATTSASGMDDSQSFSSTASGSIKRKQNICSDIRFFGWTAAAMAVPIALLIIYSSLNLVISVNDIDVINDNRDLLWDVHGCTPHIMRERGTLGPYVLSGTDAAKTTLEEARAATDKCRDEIQAELIGHADRDNDRYGPLFRAHASDSATLARFRLLVENRQNAHEARVFLTQMMRRLFHIFTVVMLQINGAQSQLDIAEFLLIADLRNYIGWARGVGNVMAKMSQQPPMELFLEYRDAKSRGDLLYEKAQDSSRDEVRQLLQTWRRESTTQRMFALLDLMARDPSEVQKIGDRWWPEVSAALDRLANIDAAAMNVLVKGKATQNVITESLKMAIGVIICVVAAVLLGKRQHTVRNNMNKQLATIHRTQRAVQAFVPKFFLNAMGYTSITQVETGACTEMAVVMLFADIRQFTTIAEGMGNSELFDWVQEYFARMTHIIESNRGNVNQFIGDALFAVFRGSTEALEAATDMQASVRKLNVDNECERRAEKKATVDIGVGVHYATVAMGILGDKDRHTCTMIAASVNLASRLEGLTKQLCCQIIASDAVIEQLTEPENLGVRKLGMANVVGAREPCAIYEVFSPDERNMQAYKRASKAVFESFLDGLRSASSSRNGQMASDDDNLKGRSGQAANNDNDSDRNHDSLKFHCTSGLGAVSSSAIIDPQEGHSASASRLAGTLGTSVSAASSASEMATATSPFPLPRAVAPTQEGESNHFHVPPLFSDEAPPSNKTPIPSAPTTPQNRQGAHSTPRPISPHASYLIQNDDRIAAGKKELHEMAAAYGVTDGTLEALLAFYASDGSLVFFQK